MTDWTLIRKLMNTAIDTCEGIEQLGINEQHRGVVVNDSATIHDFLISAWVGPENLARKVICKSHDQGGAKPYIDDVARTMQSLGMLCSELVKLENIDQKIGAEQQPSIKNEVEALCRWYESFCLPELQKTMNENTDSKPAAPEVVGK